MAKRPSRAVKREVAPRRAPSEAGPAVLRGRTLGAREAVLEAAARIFAERGYAGTNLGDVADALGMSRPGLYYHFPSKEKLLEALLEDVTFSRERRLAQMVNDPEGDPEERLRNLVRVTTHWLLQNHVLFRILDRAEPDLRPDLKASHDASKRAVLEQFTDVIRDGIASGRFRPVDPHVTALTISGMRNWVAWWYRPDGRLSADEIADAITEMALRSVLRSDAHRSRSDRLSDVVRILHEDVAHLSYLIKDID